MVFSTYTIFKNNLSLKMEFWEAYESTMLVEINFHLKTCSLITNKHSIAGKFVLDKQLKL